MSSPAPSPSHEPAPSQPKPFWNPGKLIATALAVIAAVAGLIANLTGIFQFLQPSLSGQWLLTMHIQQSTDSAYVGKTATFQIFLINDGQNVTGAGEKIQVDGKDIPIAEHQPIQVQGQLSGSKVILTYDEKPGPDGRARETSGQFTLNVIRAGILSRRAARMDGAFTGTAAAITGTVTAEPKP